MKNLILILNLLFFCACASNQNTTIANPKIQAPEALDDKIAVNSLSETEQNNQDLTLLYPNLKSADVSKTDGKIVLNLVGKSLITKSEFTRTANSTAKYIRDFYDTKDKILVLFETDEKLIYHGEF